MEYGEEPHSAADKGIGLKATWNYYWLSRLSMMTSFIFW